MLWLQSPAFAHFAGNTHNKKEQGVNMKYSLKAIQDNIVTTKTVLKNVIEFVDASCLAAVSGFAIFIALKHLQGNWYKALLFAGVVIALQAFILLVRHFNHPN